MAAREEILARLRLALRDVPPDESPDDVPVARDYHRTTGATPAKVRDLFAERVADYRATVHRCRPDDLAGTVAAVLAEATTLAVPADLPPDWYAGFTGILRSDDPPLDVSTLDTTDAVLTGCAAAVAASGTIVLDGTTAQGRRALTLVPDHHVCVVRADQIADILPAALSTLDPARPLTFISGPSATSDIEFNRVEGVHGPRRLDVVLVTATRRRPAAARGR